MKGIRFLLFAIIGIVLILFVTCDVSLTIIKIAGVLCVVGLLGGLFFRGGDKENKEGNGANKE